MIESHTDFDTLSLSLLHRTILVSHRHHIGIQLPNVGPNGLDLSTELYILYQYLSMERHEHLFIK